MSHALANIGALVVLALAVGVLIAELDLNGGRILDALLRRPMR